MLLAVNTELSNHVSILNLIIYFWKSELGEMLLWEKTKKTFNLPQEYKIFFHPCLCYCQDLTTSGEN